MKKEFVKEVIKELYPDWNEKKSYDFTKYDIEKWDEEECKEIVNIIKESLSTSVKERSTAVFHFV